VRGPGRSRDAALGMVLLAVIGVVFLIPFLFMLLIAAKSRAEASRFEFSLPTEWRLWENLQEVLATRDGLIITAFQNSIVLTIASVALIVLAGTMVAFVLQRRRDRVGSLMAGMLLLGLILPPALVPTIYMLQWIGLFKSLLGLILVEVALILPFAVLIFRTFMAAIPRELDEAAIIDGATPWSLFFRVIFPLLRPAVITVIVVSSVAVYNDFVNPLYFLPGDDNATVQLTLFNFQAQFSTRWNLLFADVLLITIPPMVMFIFFQRQIVSGMTAGAVKG
jgi:raffinose/stachyose/melibiose transport system permease protein